MGRDYQRDAADENRSGVRLSVVSNPVDAMVKPRINKVDTSDAEMLYRLKPQAPLRLTGLHQAPGAFMPSAPSDFRYSEPKPMADVNYEFWGKILNFALNEGGKAVGGYLEKENIKENTSAAGRYDELVAMGVPREEALKQAKPYQDSWLGAIMADDHYKELTAQSDLRDFKADRDRFTADPRNEGLSVEQFNEKLKERSALYSVGQDVAYKAQYNHKAKGYIDEAVTNQAIRIDNKRVMDTLAKTSNAVFLSLSDMMDSIGKPNGPSLEDVNKVMPEFAQNLLDANKLSGIDYPKTMEAMFGGMKEFLDKNRDNLVSPDTLLGWMKETVTPDGVKLGERYATQISQLERHFDNLLEQKDAHIIESYNRQKAVKYMEFEKALEGVNPGADTTAITSMIRTTADPTIRASMQAKMDRQMGITWESDSGMVASYQKDLRNGIYKSKEEIRADIDAKILSEEDGAKFMAMSETKYKKDIKEMTDRVEYKIGMINGESQMFSDGGTRVKNRMQSAVTNMIETEVAEILLSSNGDITKAQLAEIEQRAGDLFQGLKANGGLSKPAEFFAGDRWKNEFSKMPMDDQIRAFNHHFPPDEGLNDTKRFFATQMEIAEKMDEIATRKRAEEKAKAVEAATPKPQPVPESKKLGNVPSWEDVNKRVQESKPELMKNGSAIVTPGTVADLYNDNIIKPLTPAAKEFGQLLKDKTGVTEQEVFLEMNKPRPSDRPLITADQVKSKYSITQSGVDTYLDIVGTHADRLGVSQTDAANNLYKFAQVVGEAENSGNLSGKNPNSTAKGLYQFLDDSLETALNRLSKSIGWEPWMKEAAKSKDANSLNYEQQTLLFAANMLEMKGSDKYVQKILKDGDVNAMTEAYMKLHHTNPDTATWNNWSRALKATGMDNGISSVTATKHNVVSMLNELNTGVKGDATKIVNDVSDGISYLILDKVPKDSKELGKHVNSVLSDVMSQIGVGVESATASVNALGERTAKGTDFATGQFNDWVKSNIDATSKKISDIASKTSPSDPLALRRDINNAVSEFIDNVVNPYSKAADAVSGSVKGAVDAVSGSVNSAVTNASTSVSNLQDRTVKGTQFAVDQFTTALNDALTVKEPYAKHLAVSKAMQDVVDSVVVPGENMSKSINTTAEEIAQSIQGVNPHKSLITSVEKVLNLIATNASKEEVDKAIDNLMNMRGSTGSRLLADYERNKLLRKSR